MAAPSDPGAIPGTAVPSGAQPLVGAVPSGPSAPSLQAVPVWDRLDVGETLRSGETLGAISGQATLVLQFDGNLVVYGAGSRPLWSSNTAGRPATRLTLQSDGNLVLYTEANVPVWFSSTSGQSAMLVMQSDGNLVLTTTAGVRWAAMSTSSVLRNGDTLQAGQSLTSPDGSWTFTVQGDGNVVLYLLGRARWATQTGVSGARLILQPDGNLVLYDGATKPRWATYAYGTSAVALGDFGSVVGRNAAQMITWSTFTGSSRLVAGWSMSSGERLLSPQGRFVLIMQSDGNLVLYNAQFAPVWSSRTYGQPGSSAALLAGGGLVVLSPAGRTIWQALPANTAAQYLDVQDDGNLVAYTSAPTATWSAQYGTGRLLDYPAQTTPPAASVSRYVRNLRSDAQDAVLMQAEGCDDGRANPAGNKYLVLLAVGAQTNALAQGWGVLLTTTSIGVSNDALVSALTAYIDGYASCMAVDSQVTIAVGTNNDSSVASARGGAGAMVFAQSVINPLASYASRYAGVSVAGANDIEPGFRGTQDEALDWTRQFLQYSAAPYVFFGSADGCAYQTLGPVNGACNHGYTQMGLYELAYGLAPARMIAMPQIYFAGSMPTQWANISLTGVTNGGSRIAFGGPLTEATACAQAGSCTSLSASDAWQALWVKLMGNSSTSIPGVPYATDLRIDVRPAP